MADYISDITLPGGTNHPLAAYKLKPLMTKTYPAFTCSANDINNGNIYFLTVTPSSTASADFYKPWRVRYRVTVTTTEAQTNGFYDCDISANGTTIVYKVYNMFYSTDYRPIYNHTILRPSNANAHTTHIGVRIYSARNSTALARTIKVEVLEVENCLVAFKDSLMKYSGIDKTNLSNTELSAMSQGLQETGDADTITQHRVQYTARTPYTALYRYQMLLTKSETQLLPINAVNNNIGTTKTLTTEEFDPFGQIYYYNSTTNVSAGGAIANNSIYDDYWFDLRYSFNTGTTLTANKAVYLKAVPQTNGKAKLASTPIVQSLPTSNDGFIYIYLGHAYATTHLMLEQYHPVYEYVNGIRLYTGSKPDVLNEATVVPSQSIASATNVDLAIVSLARGTYLIIFTGNFSANATGFRSVSILIDDEASAPNARVVRTSAVAAIAMNEQVTCVLTFTETTSVKFRVYHNAGTALNVVGVYSIVKLL